MQICQSWEKNPWLFQRCCFAWRAGQKEAPDGAAMLENAPFERVFSNAVWAKWAFNIIPVPQMEKTVTKWLSNLLVVTGRGTQRSSSRHVIFLSLSCILSTEWRIWRFGSLCFAKRERSGPLLRAHSPLLASCAHVLAKFQFAKVFWIFLKLRSRCARLFLPARFKFMWNVLGFKRL